MRVVVKNVYLFPENFIAVLNIKGAVNRSIFFGESAQLCNWLNLQIKDLAQFLHHKNFRLYLMSVLIKFPPKK